MSGYEYELFVRDAFGCKVNGEDPAGLSEATIYNTSYERHSLNRLKIGIGSSMLIYNRKYENEKKLRDPDDYKKMEYFINRVLEITSTEEAADLLSEYKKFMEELNDLENVY